MPRAQATAFPAPPDLPAGLLPAAEVTAGAASHLVSDGFVDAPTATVLRTNGLRAEHAEFRGCPLPAAEFDAARFTNSRFVSCDLANTRWRGAVLKRIEFIDCRLTGADLSDAQLSDVTFRNCKLDLSRMFDGKLLRIAMHQCDMRQAEFENCSMDRITFRDCDLRESRFARLSSRGIDLRGSRLDGWSIDPAALPSLIVDPRQTAAIVTVLGASVRDVDDPL
jgi:uncharacterized protein YjbI with pentapeptide repeats